MGFSGTTNTTTTIKTLITIKMFYPKYLFVSKCTSLYYKYIYKLDGVGPVDNRPSTG